MSLDRRNLVLGAVLALLAATHLLLAPGGTGRRAVSPLLPSFAAERAAWIRIERAGEALELVRRGEVWRVDQRHGFPALLWVVDGLLGTLAGLSTADLVGAEGDSHALYGLDEGAVRVRVRDHAGADLADFYQGRPEGLASGSYVRLADADQVYRASSFPPLEVAPKAWVDTRLLDVDFAAVTSIRASLAGASEELALTRTEDGRWRRSPDGRMLRGADVDPLLIAGGNLYFADVRGVLPLEPETRIAFTAEDGVLVEILLGPELDAEFRAASRADWDPAWVVELPAASAERLERLVRDLTRR